MKKLLCSLFTLLALISCADAQSVGKLKAGNVWGNPTGASAYAISTSISAIFDQQFTCSGQGSILERGASAWGCFAPGTLGKPLVSGGASADIVYQTLGVIGGGTGAATFTAHGILFGEGTSAFNVSATGAANAPLIGQGASSDPIWSTILYPSSATSGGVACFSSATTMISSAAQTANSIMLGGGAGVCPSTLGSLGTTSTVLHGNAAGAPTFGSVAYADVASAALATQTNYFAATANTIVPASVIYTTETTTTYGLTTTFDFSTFINTAVTLTGNITTQTLTNITAGKAGHIRFIQDATGSRTTVWNSNFKFASGATPTLSTAANAVDILFYDCATTSFCVASLTKDVR